MRLCSESIAQLAAALAKAQLELVNPAKTMTGIIDRWGSGNEGQTYRYAPLSAGLDIVRQTLCKHDLAVIQTTELDRDTAMVLLTTTLAHGSGEWIAASWPVCRMADMSNPKLMGSALTYARRYGLFTLVGIAGEDDLDAPELPSPTLAWSSSQPEAPPRPRPPAPPLPPQAPAPLRSQDEIAARSAGADEAEEAPPIGAGAAESATGANAIETPADRLRPVIARARKRRSDAGMPRRPREQKAGDSLEAATRELQRIEDPDTLFAWALGVLPLRNALPDSDRATLDAAFFEKADEVDADPEVLIALEQGSPKPNGLAPAPPT